MLPKVINNNKLIKIVYCAKVFSGFKLTFSIIETIKIVKLFHTSFKNVYNTRDNRIIRDATYSQYIVLHLG